MKQTAVEWYEIEISSLFEKYEAKEISIRDFIIMKHNLFYLAKEMEKQQIINSISNANKSNNRNVSLNPEQYYNETFNKQ
jgi:hypothetical protein